MSTHTDPIDETGGHAAPTADWLAAALQAEPGPAPSAQLWSRIERSHQRRRRRRQLLQTTSLACVLGVLSVLGVQPWQSGSSTPEPELARHSDDAAQVAHSARLRQIDRQLEAAYARGDSGAIDTLWQRREHMLHTLKQESDDESSSILAL